MIFKGLGWDEIAQGVRVHREERRSKDGPGASSMWRGCGDVEEPAKGLRRGRTRWEKIWRRVWSAGSHVTKLFPAAEKEGSQGDENKMKAL